MFFWIAAHQFMRISAFLYTSPPFATVSSPKHYRFLLAAAITAFLAPLNLSHQTSASGFVWPILTLAREIFIGIILGFAVRIPIAAVEGAGHLVDMQMGFGMASILNPMTHESESALASLWGFTATMIFISLDGHLWLLRGLSKSFIILPIGGDWPQSLRDAIFMTSTLLVTSIQIAAPIATILLITEMAMALISRSMPQMNLLMLGFPVRIGIGLISIAVAFPFISRMIIRYFESFLPIWLRLLSLGGRV